jgi:hypothetical protein
MMGFVFGESLAPTNPVTLDGQEWHETKGLRHKAIKNNWATHGSSRLSLRQLAVTTPSGAARTVSGTETP